MTMIKDFFAKQSIGFYISLATAIFALMGIIGYNILITDLMGVSGEAFALLTIALILQVITIVLAQFNATKKYFGFGTLLTGLMYGAALILILISRMPWFMSIDAKNNVPQMDGKFWFAIVMIGITTIASVTASFFRINKTIE